MKSHARHSSAIPETLLREAGFKATPKRLALIELLLGESQPLPITTLAQKLGKRADAVTVYRALEAFTAKGLTRKVDFQHGHAHYELVAGREHHHHVVCNTCGTVEDIDVPHAEKLHAMILRRTKMFAAIESHALEFFGICQRCIASPA